MKVKSNKENRTHEVRVIVQPSLYEKLQNVAGEYRTISEVVREMIVKCIEDK
jgi:hypothetical protein